MKIISQRIYFLKMLVDNQAEDVKYLTPLIELRTNKGKHKGKGELPTTKVSIIEEEFENILDHEPHVGVRIRPEYCSIISDLLYKELKLDPEVEVTTDNISESKFLEVVFNKAINLFTTLRLARTSERHATIFPTQFSESDTSWIKLNLIFEVVFNQQKISKEGIHYDEIIQETAKRIDPTSANNIKLTTATKIKIRKSLSKFFDKYALLLSRKRKEIELKLEIFEEKYQIVKITDFYWWHGETAQQLLNYFEAKNLTFDFNTLFTQCILWTKNASVQEETKSPDSETVAGPSEVFSESEGGLLPVTPNGSIDFSRLSLADVPSKESKESKQEADDDADFFKDPKFLTLLEKYSTNETVSTNEFGKEEVRIISSTQNVREFFNAIDQKDFDYAFALVNSDKFDPNLTRGEVNNKCDEDIAKETALFEILQIAAMNPSPVDRNSIERTLAHLFELGANINQVNSQNESLLEVLIENNFCKLAKELISRGVEFNRLEKSSTALHIAASKGLDEMVQLLLEKGAEVDAEDDFGANTPLHIAVSEGQIEAIKLLLKHGADPDEENEDGETPRGWAKENLEILVLFSEWESKQQEVEETQSQLKS